MSKLAWLAAALAVPVFAQQPAGPLRIAVGGNYLPLHGTIGSEPAGLEIDLGRALGKELGREVVFINPADLKVSSLDAVSTGQADVSLNSVTPTPEREKLVDFSAPYVKLHYLLAAKAGTTVTSLDAVKGRVAVVTGPVSVNVGKLLPNALLVEVKTLPLAVQKLVTGMVDYLVAEDVGVLLAIKDQKLVAVGPPFGEAIVALAAPKGQLAPYAAALKKLEPKVAELTAKWKPGALFENPDDANKPKSTLVVTKPANEANLFDAPIVFEGTISADCTELLARANNGKQAPVRGYKKGNTTFRYALTKEGDLTPGGNTVSFDAKCANGTPSAFASVYWTDVSTMSEMAKPVIYLYPRAPLSVVVRPRPEGGVTLAEPPLDAEGRWHTLAQPDGTLIDELGQKWSSLFWEGKSAAKAPEAGFCVSRAELPRFFDRALTKLGLQGREVSDFKAYWLPRMTGAARYRLRFVSRRELDTHAPLDIQPAPDTLIRVYFVHDAVSGACPGQEPKLETPPARTGFTVVEWGGRPGR